MSNKIKLTDTIVKNLSSRLGTRLDHSDIECPGLNIRVTENGVKTFSYAYRIGRNTGRYTIGKYPEISLKKARTLTNQMKLLVLEGEDPRATKQSRKRDLDNTVTKMIEEFIEVYAKPKNSSWKQAQGFLKRHLEPSIGKIPVTKVSRSDIHTILDHLSLTGRHVTCNRTLAHIKRFFNWLAERGYIDDAPTDHIKARHAEKPRERVLSDEEIKAIWNASEFLGKGYRNWVKLLFLCGQRETETARIRKSQIEENVWFLSSKDTKNKTPNLVPFPKQASIIINNLSNTDNDFLLTSGRNGDNPFNGFSKTKNRIDRLSGISDWTWHDIRAAVATNLAKLKFSRATIKQVLNHKDNGVTAIYDRYNYIEEKKNALQCWADKLDEIIQR